MSNIITWIDSFIINNGKNTEWQFSWNLSFFSSLPYRLRRVSMALVMLIKFSIIFFIININLLNAVTASNAGDIKDQIMNILTSLTCETQGIGDLLSAEFSHTCIPAPFFTFAVANIVAPLTYANTILRLKINDNELFPNACGRDNRIDFNDQKLSFGLCSNIKLTLKRAGAVASSIIAIADAMITGEDPWQKILDSWNIPKADYHNIFPDEIEGATGIMFDAGVPPVIPWKVIKDNDKMCVATTTITFGWIPVGCKYIREPYPQSIYSDFMDLSPGGTPPINTNDVMQLTKCSGAGGGCFQRAYNNSKTGIVISAPIIECIKEMTARLLVSNDVCGFDNLGSNIGTINRNTSTLFQFQKNMQRFVTAFLSIYVVFFGLKIILGGAPPAKAEFFNFIFKIVFVIYFSVGISVNGVDRLDGMVQWVIPTLLDAMQQFASWIISASPSDLCVFNVSEYATGFGHLSLWDSLDCRVSHYLGLDLLRTMMVENMARNHDFASFDFFSFSVPPYYYLLIPAVMSGSMTLVSLALAYPLLVVSVAAYLVNSTVVCIIAIVILSVLAPLFVPMLLFNYTRGYFDAWVKLMLSFVLQPMVVVAFMITMFSVYDFGFYGKCKYTHKDVKADLISISPRIAKIFFIDNNWGHYASEEDVKSCKDSLGFILNNPLAALYDMTKDNAGEMVGKVNTDTKSYMSNFPFLNALSFSPSMFFTGPKMIFEKIKDLILALITACFTLYLMYHFSAQLSEFAADMTEGVSLSDVSIKPQAIFKAGMAAISAAGNAMSGDASSIGRGGLSKDTASIGGGGSSDTASIGGDGSSDTASIGESGESSDTTSVGSSGSSGGSISRVSTATSQGAANQAAAVSGSSSTPATPTFSRFTKSVAPIEAPRSGLKNINVQEGKPSKDKASKPSEKIKDKEAQKERDQELKTQAANEKAARKDRERDVKQSMKLKEWEAKDLKQSIKEKELEEKKRRKEEEKLQKEEVNKKTKKDSKGDKDSEGKKSYPKEKHPGTEDGTIKPEYGAVRTDSKDLKKASDEVGSKYDPTKDKDKDKKGADDLNQYDPTKGDNIYKDAAPPPYDPSTAPQNLNTISQEAPKDKNISHPTKGKTGAGDLIVEGYGVVKLPKKDKTSPGTKEGKDDK